MHTIKTLAVWLLYALAFLPLLVTKSLFFPYISGKSIAIRLIVTVAMLLFATLLVKGIRDQGSGMRKKARELFKNKTFLFVCGYIAVLIISTIFAVDSYRAFFGDTERAEGLLTMLYLFGFFGLVSFLFERKDWMNFFKATLVAGTVLFIHEIIQVIQGADRPASFTGNPIYLATVFLFVLFAAWEVFREYRTAWENREGMNFFWFVLAALMLPLSILGIFITRTRGMIAGLVAGVVAVLLYLVFRKNHNSPDPSYLKRGSIQRWALYGLGAIVLVGIIFAVTSQASFWKSVPGFDRLSEFTLHDATLQTRLISLGVSLRAINPAANGIEKLLIGWGSENFNIAYNAHFNPTYFEYEQAWFDRAHNKLMDVLVMNGLIGFVVYLGIWISLWAALRNTNRKEVLRDVQNDKGGVLPILFFSVAYFVQNLFVFDSIVTYIPFFAFVAYAIYSSGAHHTEVRLPQTEAKSHAHAWLPWVTGGLSLFFVVAFIAWTIVPYAQLGRYVKVIAGRPTPEQFNSLFTPYTFTQELIRQHFLRSLAGAYTGKPEETNLLQKGIDQMRDLIAREPHNPRYHVALGGAYDAMGKQGIAGAYAQGEEIYREAMQLAPRRQDIYYLLAYNLSFQKRFNEAVSTMREAVSFDEKVPQPHFYLGMILTSTNDPKNYHEAFDQLRAAEELTGNKFGTDKNGPQAVYFLLTKFYDAKDREYTLQAVDLLEQLLPDKKSQLEVVRQSVISGSWKPITFR